MTIKEAFEKLHKAVKTAGLNPFFLISNLKDTFKDVADNVVDAGGSVVEVESAQDSGYLVGNVKVDGEDNYLFAPPQIIPPHIYDTTERLVAVFFHDGISEDVYERTIIKTNLHFDNSMAIIDSSITKSSVQNILGFNGSVVTADGSGYTSLCGLPGMSLWVFGIHVNINGLGLYGSNSGAMEGGKAICTIRYTKPTE